MLFKTIEELQAIVAINVCSTFDPIVSKIEDAEQDYIIPAIGQEFYDELDLVYNDDMATPTEEQLAAIAKIQKALGYLAHYLYMPELKVQISNTGIHRIQNEGMKNAFQNDERELAESWLMQGLKKLEQALLYFELHKEDYETWAESDAYTEFKELFIISARMFDTSRSIGESRLTYMKLRAVMRRVEREFIYPIVLPDLFAELKTQITENTLSGQNEELLNSFIRPAVAHLSIYEGIAELGVEIGPNGIVLNYFKAGFDNSKEIVPVDDARLNNLRAVAYKQGMKYVEMLKKELLDNSANYTTYTEDDEYDSEADIPFENDEDAGIVYF